MSVAPSSSVLVLRGCINIRQRGCSCEHPLKDMQGPTSEAEAGLEIDDPRSQRTGRMAKAWIVDVGVDRAGVDIQQVKGVEHVGLDLDPCTFAQDTHLWQTEGFADGQVYISVAGTGERVAVDSRRRYVDVCRLSGVVRDCGAEVGNTEEAVGEQIVVCACARAGKDGGSALVAGEVASGLEGIVAGTVAAAAKIVGTQLQVSVVAAVAIELVRGLVV